MIEGASRSLVVEDAHSTPPFSGLAITEAAGIGAYTGVPVRHADGRLFGTLCTLHPTRRQPEHGELTLLTLAGRLITQGFAAEEIRQANAELARASQMKSEFLANMSHELRTPLNAIIGFSEVLVDETFGALNARQARYAGNILDSGRHLLGLINDILDLSKVEAGRMELHREQVALGALLAEVREQMAPLAAQREVTLALAPPDSPVEVHADRARVVQILYNLLSNAIKFTPEGGRVTLRAGTRGRLAEIAVQDTGIGIAPEDQARVFEEFSQVDSSLGRQQQGTGLGLGLTKRLVELHGGTITLESAPGQGSTFTVTLPSAAPAEVEQPETGPRGLVLVVEDDPAAYELLRVYLEGAGYSARGIAHAAEALAQARAARPVAIVLDLLLDGEVAWPILQGLKADPLTCDIPVVIASSLDEQAHGFALGASAYLTKPLARQEFLATLARVAGVAATGPVRVLAVDDDPLALELIALTLATEGDAYELVGVSSVAEALVLLAGRRPDVLLVDLLMAPLDGYALLDAVAADARLSGLPIIVITAKTLSAADRQRLSSRGAATLPKGGLGQQRLLRELARVIGHGGPP